MPDLFYLNSPPGGAPNNLSEKGDFEAGSPNKNYSLKEGGKAFLKRLDYD